MTTTTANQSALTGFDVIREQLGTVTADRIAQNSMLSELPGIAFAILTLAYIISSLASL